MLKFNTQIKGLCPRYKSDTGTFGHNSHLIQQLKSKSKA